MLLADVVLQSLGTKPVGQRPFRAGIGRRCEIKQAHARNDLCRRASYRRIPAATAAFKDSTPTVGIERAIAPARICSLTPRASLPITSAQLRVRSTAAGSPALLGMAA